MALIAEMERVLARVERGQTSARLDPGRNWGQSASLVRRFNALLQQAQASKDVYPRELSLAHERYEELLRVLSALRRLSDVLCTARSPEEICSWAAEVLADELEYEHCSVLLYDRDTDQLHEVGLSDRKAAGRRRRYPARTGQLGLAFRRRRPTLHFPPRKGKSAFVALAPLRADGVRIGLIKLARPLRGVPSKHIGHGLVLLSAIAAQMLRTVELKRRLDELNHGLGREVERFSTLSIRRNQELQRLEAVLEALIDSGEEPVLIFTKTGRLFRLNRAAAALWGRPAAALLGRRVTALLPKKMRRQATAAAVEALRAGRPFEGRIAMRTGAGRKLNLDVSLRPVAVPGGDWLCLVSATPCTAKSRAGRAAEKGAGEQGAAKGKKLLIIDDEVPLLESLKELLADLSHEVTVAASATEGVRKAVAGNFDLVLTDLGLPEMSGWEVAERIKARRPATQVGIMTGWETGTPPSELKARGIDFVLRKPFDLSQILECLEAASSPTS